MKKPNESLKAYRHNLERETRPRLSVLGQAAGSPAADAEFPPGADELVIRSTASRRKFMGILGASTALAGLSSGCIRKPVENILPYAKRPEDSIPGKALYYATGLQIGGTVHGLLVETHEGRPTKVEGNPGHPTNRGSSDVFAQGTVLGLYDPDRSKAPRSRLLQAQLVLKAEATEAQAKELVVNKLCTDLYDHTLEASKSADRARTVRDQCKFDATEGGKGQFSVSEKDGNKVAEIAVPSEEAMETTWDLTWYQLDKLFEGKAGSGGDKMAFVVRDSLSPAILTQIATFKQKYPQSKIFISDAAADTNRNAAAEMLAGPGARMRYSLANARVIATFDADIFGTETDAVRLSREWAEGRKVGSPTSAKKMSRTYAVEPHLTTAGAAADHRLAVKGAEVVNVLLGVVGELFDKHKLGQKDGKANPPAADALFRGIDYPDRKKHFGADRWNFIQRLAADLAGRKDKSVVIVGERQPPEAHALGALINAMLGSLGSLCSFTSLPALPIDGQIADLGAALDAGQLDTVVCLGTNPVYDAPGSLAMADKLSKVRTLIHAGTHRDETAQIATWHLPVSHEFEAWGDVIALDGTVTVAQPLIAPLYDTPSLLEVMGRILTPGQAPEGVEMVRAIWGRDEKAWRKLLHEGTQPQQLRPTAPNGWEKFVPMLAKLARPQKGWEVNFHLDPTILDGRFANNGWLQEIPHPTSKVAWDNAAYINPFDAQAMGVKNGDFLAIKLGDRSAAIPAWIAPGQARKTISVNLGYGREGLGVVAEGSGFDANKLRSHEAPSFEYGSVEQGAGHYLLACTQEYGYLDPDGPKGKILEYGERPIYRETTAAGFKKDPNFSSEGDLMPPERLKSLWDHPELVGKQQWGMSIDLNLCTGCNTCTVACGAENNIPVVGKDMVANGRELHWIRIDRYYRDFTDQPRTVVMPVGCMHCETAPCENVCPVQATAHSPEGLNDMAYNRCIGTRYCANNCPYKVRRFNFFNFNLDVDPVSQMQKNPNVTLRFRGVIEKCTYCVQRINAAKIDAHVAGEDTVADGTIVMACEQACPTGAIVFGDVADEETRVSKLKKQPRDYGLLTDLNTHPRTSYLGRVTNPNPKLAQADAKKAETKEG